MNRIVAILLAFLAVAAPAHVVTGPIRAAVGKPLHDAQMLAVQKNYQAAMAKVDEAEAVPNQTADESHVIAEMKDYIAGHLSRP